MRRMSFALTTDAVRARTKTVTRRLGWTSLEPGEQLLAVDKLRSKTAEKLAVIEVVNVRRERLNKITESDVRREAIDTFDYCDTNHADENLIGSADCVDCFVDMFCAAMRCAPNVLVNRIEFRYLDEVPA